MPKTTNFHFVVHRSNRWNDLLDGNTPHPEEVQDRMANGVDIWIALTYLIFTKNGYKVTIGRSAKPDKINIIDGITTGSEDIRSDCFYVSCRNDGHFPSLGNVVLHQNLIHTGRKKEIYMPQWPQPGLVFREASRENSIKKIAFFGQPKRNLLKELQTKEFKDDLEKRGVEFAIEGKNKGGYCWNNYSDVDLILAVRDKLPSAIMELKPVNKVTNSWLAGALCITGPEPAILATFKHGEPLLIATTAEDILKHIDDLQAKPERFEALRKSALKASADYCEESVFQAWVEMEKAVTPRFQSWQNLSPLRKYGCYLQKLVDHRISKFTHKRSVTRAMKSI